MAQEDESAASIVDLQMRVAFQEDGLRQLEDLLTRQQTLIERLQRQLSALQERLGDLEAQGLDANHPLPNEDPPPHY